MQVAQAQLFGLCIALAVGPGCFRGDVEPGGSRGVDRAVSVSAPSIVRLERGRSVSVSIRIQVGSGLHVQANPASRETLIPLTLEVEAKDGVRLASVHYPEAREMTGGRLRVYTGVFEVKAAIAADLGARLGQRVKLPAKLRYQACDEAGTCRFPAAQAFVIEVEVEL